MSILHTVRKNVGLRAFRHTCGVDTHEDDLSLIVVCKKTIYFMSGYWHYNNNYYKCGCNKELDFKYFKRPVDPQDFDLSLIKLISRNNCVCSNHFIQHDILNCADFLNLPSYVMGTFVL
jgi:hypothetical protein